MTRRPKEARASAGFTLFEFAVVLTVTALVGALAVSAYRTYTVRAEIASGIASTVGVRERVIAAFNATGIPPKDRLAAAIPPGRDASWGDFVEDIEIVNGRVDIRFGRASNEAIAGRTLSMTPYETADQRAVWLCGNQLPGVGLDPLGFAGGTTQPVQVLTRIEARYLPPNCR
jgi:hypothetical protein